LAFKVAFKSIARESEGYIRQDWRLKGKALVILTEPLAAWTEPPPPHQGSNHYPDGNAQVKSGIMRFWEWNSGGYHYTVCERVLKLDYFKQLVVHMTFQPTIFKIYKSRNTQGEARQICGLVK